MTKINTDLEAIKNAMSHANNVGEPVTLHRGDFAPDDHVDSDECPCHPQVIRVHDVRKPEEIYADLYGRG